MKFEQRADFAFGSAALGASGFDAPLENAIKIRISEPRYDLWFRNHTKMVYLGEELVVGVPNLYFHDWLQKTFEADIRAAAHEVFGHPVAVRFAIDPELFQAVRQQQEQAKNTASTIDAVPVKKPVHPELLESPRAESPTVDPSGPGPTNRPHQKTTKQTLPRRHWRSLREFVVGPGNRVAHASAQNVIDEPGLAANPLVIYGPTGTGKTHLLEGIYSGLRLRFPEAKVVYVTAEDFMNRFVSAMHGSKQMSFRKQFRECHTLLFDNLSFLEGKKATQVEFLHTFDTLLAEGCQVVITADLHPKLMEDMLPEIVDRLLGGNIWGVLPPDADTRAAILRAKAARMELQVPIEVTQFLAERLRGNVREIEGALHSLKLFQKISNETISINMCHDALGDLLRHALKVVRIADIDQALVQVLQMAPRAMQSKSKAWAVSHARMLAIYLARKHTSASYGEISLYFNNKTHSTAVAAEKRVRGWITDQRKMKFGDREWMVRDLVERIERELNR